MPFCSQCGNELPDGARFCSRCGNQVVQVVSAPTAAAPNTQPPAQQPVATQEVAAVTSTPKTQGYLAGGLGIAGLLMLLFAPTIDIDLYFAGQGFSLFDLITGYNGLTSLIGRPSASDLGDLAGMVIFVAMITLVMSLLACIGIVQCFRGKKSGGFLWYLPVLAAALIALLVYLSGETYGVISVGTWLWITGIVGIVAAVIATEYDKNFKETEQQG